MIGSRMIRRPYPGHESEQGVDRHGGNLRLKVPCLWPRLTVHAANPQELTRMAFTERFTVQVALQPSGTGQQPQFLSDNSCGLCRCAARARPESILARDTLDTPALPQSVTGRRAEYSQSARANGPLPGSALAPRPRWSPSRGCVPLATAAHHGRGYNARQPWVQAGSAWPAHALPWTARALVGSPRQSASWVVQGQDR